MVTKWRHRRQRCDSRVAHSSVLLTARCEVRLLLLVVSLVWLSMTTTAVVCSPAPGRGPVPINMTIIYSAPSVTCFTWKLSASSVPVSRVRLQAAYRPVTDQYRAVSDISGSAMSAIITGLRPSTQYCLIMTSYVNNTAVGSTPEIYFYTPCDYDGLCGNVTTAPSTVSLEEITIVVIVLCVWMTALGLFFNRWGKIRMLEPYEYHFKYHYPVPDIPPLVPACSHGDVPISPMLRGSLDRHCSAERRHSPKSRRCSSLTVNLTGHPFMSATDTPAVTPEVKVSLTHLDDGAIDRQATTTSAQTIVAIVHDSAV